MAGDRTSAFGAKLRAARERRSVSLREIANKTKISMSVLEALERNDFSRLPGGIFGRAFVRSYAIEVGLDPDETIEEFLAQFPRDAPVAAGHPRTDEIEDGEALDSQRRIATTLLRLAAISVPLIGIVLYFSGGRRQSSEPPVAAPRPDAAQPTPARTADREPPVAPAAETRPADATSVSDAPPSRAGVPPPAAAAQSGQLIITLSASRPCWVVATVDGANAIEQLMQAGDERTLTVRRELVLKAGDAEALSITVNGAAAKPLGKAGEVVTARLNLANFKDYLVQP